MRTVQWRVTKGAAAGLCPSLRNTRLGCAEEAVHGVRPDRVFALGDPAGSDWNNRNAAAAAVRELLLLDEHTAALDPKSADLVIALTEQVMRAAS